MITALLVLIVLILLFGADGIADLIGALIALSVYLAGIALVLGGLTWAFFAITA